MDFLNCFVDAVTDITGANRPGMVILMVVGGIIQKLAFGTASGQSNSSHQYSQR